MKDCIKLQSHLYNLSDSWCLLWLVGRRMNEIFKQATDKHLIQHPTRQCVREERGGFVFCGDGAVVQKFKGFNWIK